MGSNVFLFFVIWVITVKEAHSFVKVFWKNYSIYDPKFWIPLDAEDCDGLVFPTNPSGAQIIRNLTVQRIVLPKDGNILLSSNSEIILDPDSTDKMNCATLNETDFTDINWSDTTGWIMEGYEDNVAVPDYERLPCEYDDIVFPYGVHTRSFSIYGSEIKIKSFKFENEYWSNEDLAYYFKQSVISSFFKIYGELQNAFIIGGKECPDSTGCVCGNEYMNMGACWYTPGLIYQTPENKFDCLEPIKPVGFCNEMCGATVQFKPKKKFKLNEFREKLKRYTSDVYASKVQDGQLQYIQVVFAEKMFTGISLTEAKDLHGQLLADTSWGAKQAVLKASGPYYVEGAELKSALFSVFGTLTSVVAAFGLLYLFFATSMFESFRHRINLGTPLDSTQFSKYFARYKASDAGLIIDVQSRAESVVNLERSFENPMYERASPSTSTTSDEAGTDLIESLPKMEPDNEIASCSFKEDNKLDETDKTELISLS